MTHNPEMLIVQEKRDFILVAQTGDAVPSERWANFVASPYPDLSAQEVSLKDLDAPAFAQQAAQRLSETVQAQELTPAQVRESAAELGREAERSLNLSVITSERMTRDTDSARQGQPQGFERMFQEAGDPASSKLLQKAAENLEQRGQDPDKLYLTVAQSGDQYEGRLEFKTSRVGVVADDQGRHLATPPSSLKGVAISDEGRMKFTASEPTKIQRQLDY